MQEQIEIRRGRTTITIDDLWKLRIRSEGIERYSRTLFRDKAHSTMYREALGRIVAGQPAAYSVRDMVVVSAIQIAASDLARTDERAAELPDWLSMAGQESLTGRREAAANSPAARSDPALSVSPPPAERSYVGGLTGQARAPRSGR